MALKTLVLFDFDGTLTKGDTLWRFLRFSLPGVRLAWQLFRWSFFQLADLCTGRWSPGRSKAKLLALCFKGIQRNQLEKLGAEFYAGPLSRAFRPDMLAILRQWKAGGATVAVVSASIDIWLAPFAAAEGVLLICTQLEFEKDRFCGTFSTPNCKGKEKEIRIKEMFHLADYEEIVAYGNSRGDREMLALAHKAYWV